MKYEFGRSRCVFAPLDRRGAAEEGAFVAYRWSGFQPSVRQGEKLRTRPPFPDLRPVPALSHGPPGGPITAGAWARRVNKLRAVGQCAGADAK
jgi:hypothetical protein